MRRREIGSARKMLRVLHYLATSEDNQPLNAISRELLLHPTTALRLLVTAVGCGFVVQDPVTRRYGLGPRALGLGLRAVARSQLVSLGQKAVIRLRDLTDETAHLSVLDGADVLDIATAESRCTVRVCSPVGGRLPAHCSSTGKVLLAHLPPERVKDIVHIKGMPAYTPNTIITLAELERDLAEVKAGGLALDLGECEEEVWCLAAPVRDHTGSCVAALGLSGLRWRMQRHGLENLKRTLLVEAEEFSVGLGYCVSHQWTDLHKP